MTAFDIGSLAAAVVLIGGVILAIAISSNRAAGNGYREVRGDQDLGYLAQNHSPLLSDSDEIENAYLEDQLGGFEPSGRPSDTHTFRKLAAEEEQR